MDLPYSDLIEIKYLTRLFDNKSECYKLFWFEAIVDLVSKGRYSATYDELINEMIVSAWYMVSEYHLNLGPSDTLEALIHRLMQLNNGILKTSDSRENILAFISDCQDNYVRSMKRILTRNVPYRLQSPF
ncbi:MAG: HNH endonuclease, partial [Clostridia bacterium]